MGLKAVIVVPALNAPVTASSGPVSVPSQSGITIIACNFSAPGTVNLPASPAVNQVVIVQDQAGNSQSNNITVSGNGNQILQPNVGLESSIIIGSNGSDVWLNWNGSKWGVLA